MRIKGSSCLSLISDFSSSRKKLRNDGRDFMDERAQLDLGERSRKGKNGKKKKVERDKGVGEGNKNGIQKKFGNSGAASHGKV